MECILDSARPPVVIEDREDAEAYDWLDWIVTEHPYVSAYGQAVLVDGSLLARLVDGLPSHHDTLLWSVQGLVEGDRLIADIGPYSNLLYRVDPDGTRRPFQAHGHGDLRLHDGRCIWHGPSLVQLLDQVREAAA